jgi:hypothetical protein
VQRRRLALRHEVFEQQERAAGLLRRRLHREHAATEEALSPLRERLAPEALTRLVHGIGATIGIEAFVWLTDIAGRSRDEAVAVMRSNALALLRAALAGTEPAGG